MQNETENLPVKLTTDEKVQRGEEQSRAIRAHQKLEDDKKEYAAHVKTEQDKLKNRIHELAAIINAGEEPRPVPVTYQPDIMSSTMEIYRVDTGTLVRSRPLTESERTAAMQPGFAFSGGGKKGGDA